jgi:hypothetical protein
MTHDEGIATIDDFLKNVDADWISKQLCSFQVPSGSTVFCPFGYVPIVIGLDDSAESADDDVLAYVQAPLLDNTSVKTASNVVRAEVAGWIRKGIASGSFAMAPNAIMLQSWLDTWPVDKPPSSTHFGDAD